MTFLLYQAQSHFGFKSIILKRHLQEVEALEFIVYETLLKVGSDYIWLWIAIEFENRQILAVSISKERNMFVVERLISDVSRDYRKHPVSTDVRTWYPQACQFLNLGHHLHSALEKSLIERTIQYIKDRTECFDDYFPCRIKNCKLNYVRNWLRFFVDYHNKEIKTCQMNSAPIIDR